MAENPVLFDASPTDDTANAARGGRKTRARELVRPLIPETSPGDRPRVYSEKPRAIRPIGKIDHTYHCNDVRCGVACNDILFEDGGHWLLQCCFCGCTQWLPAIPGHLEQRGEQFLLRDGRFAGLTLDEAAGEPRGMAYIAWAAASHQRPAVKDACKTWLDQRNAPR